MSFSLARCMAALLLAAAAATARGQSAQGRSEFRLDLVRESLTGTHRHYQQYIDGVIVIGGERLTRQRFSAGEEVTFDGSARLTARSGPLSLRATPAGSDRVFVNVNGEARAAFRTVVERRALERYARYVDVQTGVLLREDPLFFRARGRVFDVNPVAKLNRPDLRDSNDAAAAVPDAAYDSVELPDLAPSGLLTGPNARIVDLQVPTTPHADAAGSLDFDRSQPQFEEVNAYFQIDRSQRYLQSLGYTGTRALVAYSIPIDPHAANGTDSSFYVPEQPAGHGTLFFGDGGTDDAEDSDIILHEFGHAIHDWISPGGLTGAISSQARAMSEGFGDYWSFSSTYEKTKASGRDPFCIADWDARCAGDDPSQGCGYAPGADCLRRVDGTKTIADYDFSGAEGSEHQNGTMWSSALREIFIALTQQLGAAEGKRVSDILVLESLFGLPALPQFATVANRMIDVDRILRAGADVPTICTAMTSRGLLSAAACGTVPRGESTVLQSSDHAIAIPDAGPPVISSLTVSDPRLIQRIGVRVDIAHPNRGDLVINLIAPDGTTFRLQTSSNVDHTRDVHATFGIDAPTVDSLDPLSGRPAAGTWQLVVSDVFATDTGVLLSWGLKIQFAGDAPVTTRPRGGDGAIIPVVGHILGVNGSDWRSDVYVLNRGSRATTLTIVFTPSGNDGTTTFEAAQVVVESGQTVVLADVVAQLFASRGIGSLEVRGDLSSIVVWSTTYAVLPHGTLSQSIEATTAATATGSGDEALTIAPIPSPLQMRTNVGVVETTGAGGVVHINLRTVLGASLRTIDVTVAPFEHLQMPALIASATDEPLVADVTVTSGSARVIAYASAIDLGSGDPMYLAARRRSTTVGHAVVPAVISGPGAAGTQWSSELYWTNVLGAVPTLAPILPLRVTFFSATDAQTRITTVLPQLSAHVDNAVATIFGRVDDTGQIDVEPRFDTFLTTRTYVTTANGRVGERIDAVPVASAIASGSSVDALHAENSPAFRTNIGITEVGGSDVIVRMTLFSAAGSPLGTIDVGVRGRGFAFVPLSAFGTDVTNGHVHFEVVGGSGAVLSYLSVIDNGTSDATFVLAQ